MFHRRLYIQAGIVNVIHLSLPPSLGGSGFSDGALTETQIPGKLQLTMWFTTFSELSSISFLSPSLPLTYSSYVRCFAHYSHSWINIKGRLVTIYAFFLGSVSKDGNWLPYGFSFFSPLFFSAPPASLFHCTDYNNTNKSIVCILLDFLACQCLIWGLKKWSLTLCLHLVVSSISDEILCVLN